MSKNKHTQLKKEIYIPIEIKAREFASQTFLAGELAKREARVFLGSKSSIDRLVNEKKNTTGAYLYKGGGSSIKKFRDLSPKISSIAVLDQEISPAIKSYDAIKFRFVKGCLKYVSRLYYIGPEATKAATRLLKEIDPENIKNTGWPRIDLWMTSMHHIWDEEVKKIHQEFGDSFILFSSDFGVNSKRLLEERTLRFGLVGAEKTEDEITTNKQKQTLAYKSFLKFIEFLREIDSAPDLPLIIVRPHPAEDHKVWLEETSNFKNVKVVYKGDITAWLLASKRLLHRGCSTALQATISNIKTGCMIDYADPDNTSLAMKISPMLSNAEDIRQWYNTDINKFDFNSTKSILSDHITFSERSATEIIAEDLINLAGKGTIQSDIRERPIFKKILAKILNALRSVKNSKNKQKQGSPHNLGKLPKYNKMQDGIKEKEVTSLLKLMYPRQQFRIQQIIDNLCIIEKVN